VPSGIIYRDATPNRSLLEDRVHLGSPPLLDALSGAQRVLIAGAGGGFDVFSGLPLYFALQSLGKTPFLANLTFSNLARAQGRRFSPSAMEVTASTVGPEDYFPEKHLAEWFRGQGEEVSVYTFEKTGVRPLLRAYEALVQEISADAVVLVDGGIDILLRGDEAELGTPMEDVASLAAVQALAVPTKLVLCLGFGTDARHGVSHADALEAIAGLTASGGYLGALALHQAMPEVARFVAATRFVFDRMARPPSYVAAAILGALEGAFGPLEPLEPSRDRPPWVNPLLSLYWAFELEAVAERNLYLDAIFATDEAFQVTAIIDGFRRGGVPIRPRTPIPL